MVTKHNRHRFPCYSAGAGLANGPAQAVSGAHNESSIGKGTTATTAPLSRHTRKLVSPAAFGGAPEGADGVCAHLTFCGAAPRCYHVRMYYLECIKPVNGGRFPLRRGPNLLGRTAGVHVYILDPSLSRRHAELHVDGATVRLRDLGSYNGTRVGGVLVVGTHDLAVGEEVQCGDVVVVLRKEAAPPRPPARSFASGAEGNPSHTIVVGGPPLSSSDPVARRLAVLLRVGELLARPGDSARLPARILDLVAEILPVDGAVLLTRGDGDELTVAASRQKSASGEQPYSKSIVRYVLEHRVAAQFDDATTDTRIEPGDSILALSIRCSMCAPLLVDDRVLGAIYVDNRLTRYVFGSSDLELLAGFANQAAAALHNSALQAQVQRAAVQQSTLARFFPPATVEKLMESGGDLGVQELFVTALFSDISAFTAMSATMPPAEVVALLHIYFPPMARIVFARGGTLEKYIGDAMMAVWGAPFSHADDADRALEAAVEMHEAVLRMRDILPRPLDIHIGLNSGVVALANIGSAEYLQVATIGDATNTAARVCSVAGDGELVITRETADRLTRPSFPLIALPPTMVKGKAQPLQLFRVDWRR